MEDVNQQILHNLELQKSELLLKIGESVYYEYRLGNISSDELNEFALKIQNIDQEISERKQEKTSCECGATLPEGSHFCPSCGSQAQTQTHQSIVCSYCESEQLKNASFCHVCGNKQQEGWRLQS